MTSSTSGTSDIANTLRRSLGLLLAIGLSAGAIGCAPADRPDPTSTGPAGTSATAGGSASLGDNPLPGDGKPATPGTPASPLPEPSGPPATEDCVSYHPTNLAVVASGDAWLLKDGTHAMKVFDSKADAMDGLAVARNWTNMCFIGRSNPRPDRHRYIITYWRAPSGLPLGQAPRFECIPYDPAKLAISFGAPHPADPTQADWALHSGGTPLLFLATGPDALRAKLVASEHRQLCLIGHGNDRPEPYRYVMQYWRD
ncbi:MAG TPA: hypothetical protein VF163_22390 [Micromonosporaceae bacterium]